MVLAMLFLVLFSVMALGFYANVTSSTRVAGNERRRSDAFLAAESGIQFLSNQLSHITLTASTDKTVLFNGITAALSTRLNNTANMVDADTANTVRNPTRINNADGTSVFFIPGHTMSGSTPVPRFMRLGGSMAASLMVSLNNRQDPAFPNDPTRKIKVISATVLGRSGSAAAPIYRALQYDLSVKGGNASWVAPTGHLLTRGSVSMSNGIRITGNVTSLSNTASTFSGGARINGTFSYLTSPPVVNNGANITTTVQLANAPDLPTVDTTVFQQFVPAANTTGPDVITGSTSNKTLVNVRVKANTNPTFSNCTINGVIYIESPNKVSFGGGTRINGFVVQDANTPYNASTKNNSITLDNGTKMHGSSDIPMDAIPAAKVQAIQAIKALNSGSLILAPNAYLRFAGGFHAFDMGIVGAEMMIDNGFKGTATFVLATADRPFTMAGGAQFSFSGSSTSWPGLVSNEMSFGYQRSTYDEVSPWSFISQP